MNPIMTINHVIISANPTIIIPIIIITNITIITNHYYDHF